MPHRARSLRTIRGICLRFKRNRRGSAAVQFALTAPLFFAMLFAIVETSLVFVAGQVLETSVHDTARLVLTGQMSGSSGTTQQQFRDNICNGASALFTCSGLVVDVKKYSAFNSADFTSKPIDACTSTDTSGFVLGGPGEVMVVRAFYKWPLYVTGLGYYIGGTGSGGVRCNLKLLSSTAVFRNEP